MDLLAFITLAIVFGAILYYVLVYVLEIPQQELIPTLSKMTFYNGPAQQQQQLQPQHNPVPVPTQPVDQHGNGDYHPAQFNGKFIEQAIYDPNAAAHTQINASNTVDTGAPAEFGPEFTDVSKFFASNPAAFISTNRHSTYVPDVSEWNSKGNLLYTGHLNAAHPENVDAFNSDALYAPLVN